MTLRVVTYNIAQCLGLDRRVDLHRTADVIAGTRAQVVGLQEVGRRFDPRAGYPDEAQFLADKLGMHMVFGANIDLDPVEPGGPRRQYGNAILSTAPILDRDNTYLPRSGTHEQRGLLRAHIVVEGVSWQVYATHLQHDDATERLHQANAIVAAIGTPVRATVLLGDLNGGPDSPEAKALTGILVDAWPAVHSRGGRTHPNPIVHRRIDYVLRSPDGAVESAEVVCAWRAWIASDHRPVVAELGAPG